MATTTEVFLTRSRSNTQIDDAYQGREDGAPYSDASSETASSTVVSERGKDLTEARKEDVEVYIYIFV